MESTNGGEGVVPTPDQEDADGGPGIEIDVPPAPIPGQSELRSDTSFVLLDGTRYTLGWRSWPGEQGGPGFLILRRTALGTGDS